MGGSGECSTAPFPVGCSAFWMIWGLGPVRRDEIPQLTIADLIFQCIRTHPRNILHYPAFFQINFSHIYMTFLYIFHLYMTRIFFEFNKMKLDDIQLNCMAWHAVQHDTLPSRGLQASSQHAAVTSASNPPFLNGTPRHAADLPCRSRCQVGPCWYSMDL